MNAPSPIVATPLSNVTFVRLQQSENARSPISLTVAGIFTLVSFVHVMNAASFILRTGSPSM